MDRPKPVSRALTFRASSLGDTLMAKYFLENIKAAYPDARFGIVVASKAGMVRDLLKAYSWIEVIEASRKNPGAVLNLIKQYWGTDIASTQYAKYAFSTLSKIVARLITRRGGLVGFEDTFPFNNLIFDHIIKHDSNDATAEYERKMLKAVDMPISTAELTLQYIRNTDALEKYNLTSGQYIIAHLFAGNEGRGISPEKKRELLTSLATALPATVIVATGSKDNQHALQEAAKDLPITIAAGDTSIQDLINLIAESRGVVSLDTGAAHIAAHLKKPLTVIRSCVGRQWWLPGQYGKGPIVFDRDDVCKDGHVFKDFPACINSISMLDVVKSFCHSIQHS
jgi:ADP-heptose:LPS heptosyltransferase